MPSHQAAWLKSKGTSLEIGPAETPDLQSPDELLIKVEVIGFNPFEAKLQHFEIQPLEYPHILGLSFAGTVEKVGSNVTAFQPGDRVTALRPHDKQNDTRYGAYQQYALAEAKTTSKLLDETPLEDGADALGNMVTVAGVLSICQKLGRPDATKVSPPNGKKVLIYGGSSSCGGLAIRYARAMGYEVVTTSSPQNRDYVSSLEPSVIIDHTQSESDIISDLKSHGPYTAILDNIGVPAVDKILGTYLSSIGGGSYNALLPVLPGGDPIPDNVERIFESYGWVLTKPENEEMSDWFFQKFLPESLASGLIVPTPEQWIEGGLGEAQTALDLLADGKVSGKKLVMNPWE